MGRFFVLIVDDQREVARLERVSLEELLGEYLDVRDVPSGEEALLELALRPADLLIVDLGLPGLGGRELIAKVHQTHPHARFIVLTGWDEGNARRTIRGLPVHEVLFKPVNIDELVAAVRDALGLMADDEEEGEGGTAMLSYEESDERLADLLSQARDDTGVDAVVLLDDEGRVLLRSPGPIPPDLLEELRRPLVYLHNAGLDLARALHQPVPEQLFFFRGLEREYALVSVASYYMLLWLQQTDEGRPALLTHTAAMQATVAGVRDILARMGILESARAGSLSQARDETLAEAPLPGTGDLPDETVETSELEMDEQVAALLENLGEWNPDAAEVDPDAFWQEAASHKGTDLLRIDADALSYEEARRLGLVPDSDLDA